MRILMLTDDVEIDRRIFLEAESLCAKGHEVILLADPGTDTPEFEWIGNVKVERVPAPENTKLEIRLLQMSSLVSRSLGKLSALVQRGFGIIAAAVSKGFSLGIILNQKLTGLLIRAVRRARTIPAIEDALVERVVFYDPDVIHAHDLPRLRVAAKAKKRLAVPLIYDAHELYPEIGTLTPAQSKMLAKREKRYIKAADAVITVNEFIAAEIAKRYRVRLPEVILNATKWPVHLNVHARWDRFRERFSIPADHRVLLFQGWMSPTRGLQPLVRAMSQVPQGVHLVFMGYGEARLELEEITVSEGLTQRVHFMEAVPQDLLLSWTASADAGIIPYQPVDLNNYLSSPNKLFEFIQAGVPIIANDLPFLRKIVQGQGFGMVYKLEDVEDFAEAVRLALADDGSRLDEWRRNLNRLRHLFSWEEEEAKLQAIYDNLPGAVGG